MNQFYDVAKNSRQYEESATSHSNEGKLHREKTFLSLTELLNETNGQVKHLANTIKSLAEGNTELLSNVTHEVVRDIEEMKKLFDSSEGHLHDSLHDTQIKIMNHSTILNERNKEYLNSSEQVLSLYLNQKHCIYED